MIDDLTCAADSLKRIALSHILEMPSIEENKDRDETLGETLGKPPGSKLEYETADDSFVLDSDGNGGEPPKQSAPSVMDRLDESQSVYPGGADRPDEKAGSEPNFGSQPAKRLEPEEKKEPLPNIIVPPTVVIPSVVSPVDPITPSPIRGGAAMSRFTSAIQPSQPVCSNIAPMVTLMPTGISPYDTSKPAPPPRTTNSPRAQVHEVQLGPPGSVKRSDPKYTEMLLQGAKYADYSMNEMQFYHVKEAKEYVIKALEYLGQLAE